MLFLFPSPPLVVEKTRKRMGKAFLHWSSNHEVLFLKKFYSYFETLKFWPKLVLHRLSQEQLNLGLSRFSFQETELAAGFPQMETGMLHGPWAVRYLGELVPTGSLAAASKSSSCLPLLTFWLKALAPLFCPYLHLTVICWKFWVGFFWYAVWTAWAVSF